MPAIDDGATNEVREEADWPIGKKYRNRESKRHDTVVRSLFDVEEDIERRKSTETSNERGDRSHEQHTDPFHEVCRGHVESPMRLRLMAVQLPNDA